jgi:hypothetical protein
VCACGKWQQYTVLVEKRVYFVEGVGSTAGWGCFKPHSGSKMFATLPNRIKKPWKADRNSVEDKFSGVHIRINWPYKDDKFGFSY